MLTKSKVLHSALLALAAGMAWLADAIKDSPWHYAPLAAAIASALAVQLPKLFAPTQPPSS
jgi:hypothetical protein